jgi:hypothetical protein
MRGRRLYGLIGVTDEVSGGLTVVSVVSFRHSLANVRRSMALTPTHGFVVELLLLIQRIRSMYL